MRKPRGLSREERQLWDQIARKATPLSKNGFPISDPQMVTPNTAKRPEKQAVRIEPFEIGSTPSKGEAAWSNLGAPNAPAIQMENKAYRRLARGKLRPDARIDLHGMTLSEAQPALRSFILSEYTSGSRLVLVITGKGRTERDGGNAFSGQRGILRRYVPEWLRMAPLRNVVLEVREAHQRHGGGGAFYVYLRRLR